MDDAANLIAQLTEEVRILREQNAQHQHISEVLHMSEARFRWLVEQSPLSTQILSPDGWTVQVNRAWEALWGLTLEQMHEYNVLRDPQLIAKGIMPYIQRGFAGESVNIPAILYNPDETQADWSQHAHPQRWVRGFIYPIIDQAGRLREVVLIHEDITERKRAEEQLQFLAEASAVLAASLDFDTTIQSITRLAVPQVAEICVVFIAEPSGIIRPMAVRHLDLVKAEHLRMHQQDLVLDVSCVHPVVDAIRTEQPVVRLGGPKNGTDGAAQGAANCSTSACALVPLAYIIMPLTVRDEVLGAVVFGWDDSDHECTSLEVHLAEELARRAAQALDHTRLYRNAQEALRTRDEFLSIAAHELKTPLTTLSASAEVLQRRATRTQPYTMMERDQRMLTVIMEQSQRLQQQIDTFLDLSQIESGHIRLNLKLFQLCPFIKRVVSEIQPTLERHQLTYSCEPTSLAIKGDELRLEQVLQNLLQNAIKYSPDGGNITVHAMQRGAEVVIEVTDQGIGIPSEAQTKLFERFYRAGNAANLGIRGLGIGLAVVTDIVSQHGGRVGVTSVEGKGSTFTVWLPAYRDAHNNDSTTTST